MAGIYMVEEPMNTDILHIGVASVPAETPITDHQLPLLEAFRTQGDREALNALFTTLGPIALALAFRRLADVTAAEDVVQEACLDLIAGCRSYQSGRGTIKAWFMGMVLNRCRMYERSKERRQRHEGAAPPPTPSTTLPDSDLIEAVRLAVHELPEHERSTIELRFLIGLECKDVAATLGRPEKTIRSQIDRALVRLKEILLKKGIGPVEAGTVSGAMVLPVISMSEGFAKSLSVTAHSAVVPTSGIGLGVILTAIGTVVGAGLLFATIVFQAKTAQIQEKPPASVTQVVEIPASTATGAMVSSPLLIGAGPFQAPGHIQSLTFSPDSRQLAVGSKGLVIWDLPSGKEIYRVPLEGNIHGLSYRSQHEIVFIDTNPSLGTRSSTVVVWDLVGKREIRRIPITGYISHPQIDASGRWMAVPASDEPIQNTMQFRKQDCDLVLINLDTGISRVVAKDIVRKTPNLLFRIVDCVLSPDGKNIAFLDVHLTGQGKYPLRLGIVDVSTGSVVSTWDVPGATLDYGMQMQWTDADTITLRSPNIDKKWNKTFRARLDSLNVEKEDTCTFNDAHGKIIFELKNRQILSSDRKLLLEIPAEVEYGHTFAMSPDGTWLAIWTGRQQPTIANLREKRWLTPDQLSLSTPPESVQWLDDGNLALGTPKGMRVVNAAGEFWEAKERRNPYDFRRGEYPNSGRLVLTPGENSGKPVLWDLQQRRRIGQVAQSVGGEVESFVLSPSGRWLLAQSNNTDNVYYYDLQSNRQTGKIFVGNSCLSIFSLSWTKDENTVFIGIGNGIRYRSEDNKKISFPVSSGTWDPVNGQQRFIFRNDDGTPIGAADQVVLSPDEKTVFLKPESWPSPYPQKVNGPIGLYSALDGKFQSRMDEPGYQVGFTPDGTLVVGSLASVAVDTGKTMARFPQHSKPSPSHTWVAEVTTGLNVFLRDVRTGQIRWSLSLPDALITDAKPLFVKWSAAEDRLAVTFTDRVCVAWVDLFPTRPAPMDLAVTVRVAQESKETPVEAVLQLIAAGAPAVQAIGEPRSFAAIIALERLAAAGTAGAKESLEKAAKTGNIAAQDALARLQRAQEAKKRWDTPLNIQTATPETKTPEVEKPKKTGADEF